MSLGAPQVLRVLGAKLVLTEGAKGMKGAIARPRRSSTRTPRTNILPAAVLEPGQPADPLETTGPEIWEDTQRRRGRAGVGRRHRRDLIHLAVFALIQKQAKGKAIISHRRRADAQPGDHAKPGPGQPLQPGPHKIQGIGAGFIPRDRSTCPLVDRVEQVTNDESDGDGPPPGAGRRDSGWHLLRRPRWRRPCAWPIEPELAGKTHRGHTARLPAERYLSTPLFEGMFND